MFRVKNIIKCDNMVRIQSKKLNFAENYVEQ